LEFGKDSTPLQIPAELVNRFKLILATLEKNGLAEFAFSTSTIVSSGTTSEFRAATENREFDLKIQPIIDSSSFHAEVFFQVSQPDDLVPDSRRNRYLESSCSGKLNDTTVLDVSNLFMDESNKKNVMLLMTLEQKAKAASLSRLLQPGRRELNLHTAASKAAGLPLRVIEFRGQIHHTTMELEGVYSMNYGVANGIKQSK
jgi:hypothetical protein